MGVTTRPIILPRMIRSCCPMSSFLATSRVFTTAETKRDEGGGGRWNSGQMFSSRLRRQYDVAKSILGGPSLVRHRRSRFQHQKQNGETHQAKCVGDYVRASVRVWVD